MVDVNLNETADEFEALLAADPEFNTWADAREAEALAYQMEADNA